MKDFKNDVISKEYQRLQTTIYIGLGIIVLGLMIVMWVAWKDSQVSLSLHDAIVNNESLEQKAYVDINVEPYSFAYYEGESDYFYYVLDKDNYMYVVRMSNKDYEKFKNASAENIIRIEGVTKKIPSDIKKIGIDVYNEEISPDKPITSQEFDEYFGTVYIDLNGFSTNEIFIVICVIFMIVGGIVIGVGVFQKRKFSKNIKKLTEEQRKKLDDELNDKDSFYYKSAHVYLTKNYVFNFAGTFEAIPYKEIIWIYPFEIRNRGVKTGQNIQVMTKDGRTRAVAYVTTYTKKARDIFDEIYETLSTKNEKMLNGFTKENKQLAKEKIEKK